MRRLRGGGILATLAVVAAAGTVLWPHPPPASALGPPTTHLAVIVLENKEYSQVVGDPNAPYINRTVIPSSRLFSRYYATAHPSLPNYLTLTSGRFGPCATDACPARSLQSDNLFH